MKRIFLLFFLLPSFLLSQSSDLPPNPQPGNCYIRCKDETGKITGWEEVDCNLLKYNELRIENFKSNYFSKKDKKNIDRKLLNLLKKNINIEIASHYDSNAPDSINVKFSVAKGKQLAKYLIDKGVKPSQIVINALGNSQPKVNCKVKENCSKTYFKNSRYEFKVINNLPKKEGYIKTYDQRGFWRYKKIEDDS